MLDSSQSQLARVHITIFCSSETATENDIELPQNPTDS